MPSAATASEGFGERAAVAAKPVSLSPIGLESLASRSVTGPDRFSPSTAIAKVAVSPFWMPSRVSWEARPNTGLRTVSVSGRICCWKPRSARSRKLYVPFSSRPVSVRISDTVPLGASVLALNPYTKPGGASSRSSATVPVAPYWLDAASATVALSPFCSKDTAFVVACTSMRGSRTVSRTIAVSCAP